MTKVTQVGKQLELKVMADVKQKQPPSAAADEVAALKSADKETEVADARGATKSDLSIYQSISSSYLRGSR